MESSISEGSHQVAALVDEEGAVFYAKDRIEEGDEMEIMSPAPLERGVDNERGEIYRKDGRWYLRVRLLETPGGRRFHTIHSGNENPILLPAPLPPFTFLRRRING